MALEYTFNHTDLAHHNFDGSFVTHFIFTAFLLLFTIPIQVQVVTIYDRLHFHRWIHALFKNFHHIFHAVLGLYRLAQECHQLQKPACRLQKPALRTNQNFVQTSPLPDELLFALMTRSILIYQPEESPLTTLLSPQKTLTPQQDQTSIESELLAPQELTFLQLSEIFPSTQEHQEEPIPSTSTTDHHSVNKTPVHPVEPVLGTIPSENCWLKDRNRSQDIADILGMAAYEGYVQTPIQTLDGLYVMLINQSIFCL